jgi:hypothetical protein
MNGWRWMRWMPLPATAGAERAKLEAKTAQLEQQGRADSRVPMGEDHIESRGPAEELTARADPGGAAPDVALPTVESAAPSEEVGIVAKEQHGAEIDAALSRASAGTEYVKDQIGQYVPRQIVRAITDEDEHLIKVGQGILSKNDPDYLKKFPFRGKKPVPARDPRGHAMGGKLSPYISTTKQQDGEIALPDGTPFHSRGDGTGKVRIDLAYVSPANIHDVSTRRGQDFWNFSNPSPTSGAAVQALKDVVRTSEVLIRGRIPGRAILEHF